MSPEVNEIARLVFRRCEEESGQAIYWFLVLRSFVGEKTGGKIDSFYTWLTTEPPPMERERKAMIMRFIIDALRDDDIHRLRKDE